VKVNFKVPTLSGNPVEFSRMLFSCDVFEGTLLIKCKGVLNEALMDCQKLQKAKVHKSG
jgi:hypothetical protein